jgi:hypothetical protein
MIIAAHTEMDCLARRRGPRPWRRSADGSGPGWLRPSCRPVAAGSGASIRSADAWAKSGLEIVTGLGPAGDVPLGPSMRVGLLLPHLGSGLVPVLSGQFQDPLPDETVGSAKPATT